MENTKNYEQLFIAYQELENDITQESRGRFYRKIYELLGEFERKNYEMSRISKIGSEDESFYHVYFRKIIPNNCYLDPYKDVSTGTIAVAGYHSDEVTKIVKQLDGEASSDGFMNIVHQYLEHKNLAFQKLSDAHFCSVFFDPHEKTLIAGVTEPDSEYTHLYYGYAGKNRLIFSNYEDVLEDLCREVYEIPKNTYMMHGKFYTFDGKEIKKEEIEARNLAKQELDSLPDHVSEDICKMIEERVKDYLSSDTSKKTIDSEIEKEILSVVKNSIEEYDLESQVAEQFEQRLHQTMDKKIEEYMSQITVPIVHVVQLNDTVLGKTQAGFYHEKFEQVLKYVQLNSPVMLVGPAGSGKNVVVSQIADAFGLKMYYTNNASNEFKLTGFIDAGGTYRETEFYRAFKNGGMYMLDEVDCSDPSSLIVINSALANGYMAFPHETIDRHKDFRIITAANTWGKGADLQYVGRNPLDAATLDRFDSIFFDYDRKLESALYPNEEVLQFMWAFRDAVYQAKMLHIVSTRGIGAVYKKEMNGIPVEDILTSNVVKNLRQDDVNTIIGYMNEQELADNKYYEGIKRLRLVP